MGLWDNTSEGNSWLDGLTEMTRGVTGIVTESTAAYKQIKTNLNDARQLNIEQSAQGQAAGNGPVTARRLLSGSGDPGDLARYMRSPQGQQLMMLGLAGLAVYMLAK